MMTANTQNYTPELTKLIVDAYLAGTSPEALAEQTNKSVKSIVAKLSREGVYQPKSKTKQLAGPRKADLITEIATAIGTSEDLIGSLEKATREALELIAKAVRV